MGQIQGEIHKRASARRGKRSLAGLAKQGRKRTAQLRRGNQSQSMDNQIARQVAEKRAGKTPLLSLVARTRRSMERELSTMLRGRSSARSNRLNERDVHSDLMAESAISRSSRRPHAPGDSGHMR